MSIDSPNLRSIFDSAVELPAGGERKAYLDKACGAAPEVRERVDALLRAYENAGSFLESPAGNAAPTICSPGRDINLGVRIGPYKLLQQIGEGGMGTVYMAEQVEPVARRVALKIIKPGMDSRQVIVRFEAERQALALMDHPNIAKVLDAGTTDSGRPYFVMELIKGVPITTYCDEKRLSLNQRLELFQPVCEAVQHAHQKGIIHRDLKPTNVLVAEYDDRPISKVIDFGVAKATAQKLTDRTMFTEFGQVIGTVEYMSPEQAKFNQLDVDTRSDVYSLGVLLYELLTGSTPFERQRLCEAAIDEVLRIIREEEPPKPSTRVSTSDTLRSIAANRHTEPRRLSKDVSGELDWIVMKCLEKDRNRRYETANGLARDIERYLTDEPVQACPPSAAYRFRKFARRNKVALLVASSAFAILLLLATGLAISNRLIAAERNEKADALAEKEQALAQAEAASKHAQTNFWRASVAIRELMTKTAEGQDALPLEVRSRFSNEAMKYFETLIHEDSPDPMLRYETGVAYRTMGMIHSTWNEIDLAESSYQRAIQILRGLVDEAPTNQLYQQQLGYAHLRYAETLTQYGRSAESHVHYSRAQQNYESLVKDAPDSFDFALELAEVYRNWMTAQVSTGRLDDARKSYRRSVEIAEKLIGGSYAPDPYPAAHEGGALIARNASTQMEWASALVRAGQFIEAEQICRSLVGTSERAMREYPQVPIHRENLANAHRELAVILSHQKRQDEADAEVRKAIDLLPQTAASYNTFAWQLVIETDRTARFPALAVEFAQKAVDMVPTDGRFWNALGVAQYRAGQWEKAIDSLQKSTAMRKDGDVNEWFFLAMSHWQLGHKDEARKWFDKGVEWTDKNQTKDEVLLRFRTEAAELLGMSKPLPQEADPDHSPAAPETAGDSAK